MVLTFHPRTRTRQFLGHSQVCRISWGTIILDFFRPPTSKKIAQIIWCKVGHSPGYEEKNQSGSCRILIMRSNIFSDIHNVELFIIPLTS